jgi:hypothetical protein
MPRIMFYFAKNLRDNVMKEYFEKSLDFVNELEGYKTKFKNFH